MSTDGTDGADEAARRSVERLRKVGKKVPRAVREEVLGHGPRAVRPLLDLLAEGTSTSVHAAELLGALRAPEAVEPLVALLEEGPDDDLGDRLADALGALGPAVVEPVLAAFGRAQAGDTRRVLLNALARCGVRDERVLEVLLAAVDRGEPDNAATIAAQYGDLRVADRIDARFAEVEPADVPTAIRVVDLGAARAIFHRFQPSDAPRLEAAYAVIRAEHDRLVAERRARSGAPTIDPGGGLFDEGGPLDDEGEDPGLEDADLDDAGVGDAGAPRFSRVGRNEPCGCGSGKKFKRCHGAASS